MTLAELNAKIEALPMRYDSDAWTRIGQLDRFEARYLRDERLGLLGCHAGMEPTEEQVEIVHAQLFPNDQKTLL